MKNSNVIILVILYCLIVSEIFATEISGRIILINQDSNHYSVKLQINSDNNVTKLGGATFAINYDLNFINFSSEPVLGLDYTFNNFNGGTYDTATVTKISNNQIWLNISLDSDGDGILIEGPNNWTDLVIIHFEKLEPVVAEAISWNHESLYWKVYDADNITSLQAGNFNNSVIIGDTEDEASANMTYQLSQNYPNPFNPGTKIQFSIPQSSFVTLEIFNTLGEKIGVLVSEELSAGTYNYDWNASKLTSGIYLYKLQAGSFVETKKMILLK